MGLSIVSGLKDNSYKANTRDYWNPHIPSLFQP